MSSFLVHTMNSAYKVTYSRGGKIVVEKVADVTGRSTNLELGERLEGDKLVLDTFLELWKDGEVVLKTSSVIAVGGQPA